MKKQFRRINTLLIIFCVFAGSAAAAMAQTNPATKTDLPGLIKGLALSAEQTESVMKLTKNFIFELQTSSQELSKILTLPDPGLPADPQINEKITVIQKQFGIKMETYHLDLEDLIGDEKAQKIVEVLHDAIPQVLLQGSQIAASNHNAHGMPDMNSTDQQTTNNMAGMNSMQGINNMQGTNQTNMDMVNRQILTQLQSYNAMLLQMLATISHNQTNTGNLQAVMQPVYQIITNQSFLIQMLYSNLNNISLNMGNGNSGSNSMGSMAMPGK
jgi:hypothetical protein